MANRFQQRPDAKPDAIRSCRRGTGVPPVGLGQSRFYCRTTGGTPVPRFGR
jgi:hypothetical protein